MVIRISDTGPGFPAEVLETLAAGKPLDQSEGKHIGIMNTLQRLGRSIIAGRMWNFQTRRKAALASH